MKYNIGDVAWFAGCKSVERSVVCPDCFGQKALTVIKGDGSQVSIDCGCRHGCEGSRGYYTYWTWTVYAHQITIQRIEVNGQEVRYGHDDCYSCSESELFDTKEDAEKRAAELAEQHEKEELEKIYRKDKHNHTWAWHVRYHRESLKEAQRQLEYHSAKLNVAKEKAKEPESK